MKHAKRKIRRVLLINPWIYDFAAYDFWIKPVGLLSIGAVLRQRGYQISLIDCLDRHHPELSRFPGLSAAGSRKDATGKFHREELEKPPILKHVPRKYCRYGFPLAFFMRLLEQSPVPDVVLITSVMTYWYPAVRDVVRIVRQVFPGVIVVVGGIYATLCPQHAAGELQPDYLITGEGEEQVAQLFANLKGENKAGVSGGLDDLPYPAYDLYPDLRSVAILTSRGCPYHCSFCASAALVTGYRRRSPQKVFQEIAHWHKEKGIRHFALFDDALLHQSESYAKPLMRGIVEAGFEIALHTPNGLQPRCVDREMAELLFQAGAMQPHLSFETADPQRQKCMSAKVNNQDLRQALENLESAGFPRQDIDVYVMFGLPDQEEAEVRTSVQFVNDLGAIVDLASFSPIPQTQEWRKAIAAGLWQEDNDLLLTNNSLFPLWSKKHGCQRCQELVNWVKEKNRILSQSSSNPRNTAEHGFEELPSIIESHAPV